MKVQKTLIVIHIENTVKDYYYYYLHNILLRNISIVYIWILQYQLLNYNLQNKLTEPIKKGAYEVYDPNQKRDHKRKHGYI